MILKANIIGKKINRFSYYMLIFIIISMGVYTLYSLTSAYLASSPLMFLILALIALIGIATFGVLLAYFDIINIDNRSVMHFE